MKNRKPPPPPPYYKQLYGKMIRTNNATYRLPKEEDGREIIDKKNVEGRKAINVDPREATDGDEQENFKWVESCEAIVPGAEHLVWTLNERPLVITDVVQGRGRDCWGLAPLAALVEMTDLVPKMVTAKEEIGKDNKTRLVYHVNLYLCGRPVTVLLSDKFAVNENGQLVYARSPTKQLSIPMIEKALALAHSTYEGIDFGGGREGFYDLAPYSYRQLFMSTELDELWASLMYSFVQKCPMTISTKATKNPIEQKKFDDVCLVSSHIYTIRKLLTVGKNRLLQLYSPWGEYPWTGDWSDSSDKWPENGHPHEGSSGIFHLSLEALPDYFEYLDVCLNHRKNWEVSRFTGRLPEDGANSDNMSIFEFVVTSDGTTVDIIFAQESHRTKRTYKTPGIPIGLCVFKMDKNWTSLCGDLMFFSGYEGDLYRKCEMVLNRGRYMVVQVAVNHWINPATAGASTASPDTQDETTEATEAAAEATTETIHTETIPIETIPTETIPNETATQTIAIETATQTPTATTPTVPAFETPHNQPHQQFVTSFFSSKSIKVKALGCETSILAHALFSLVRAEVEPVKALAHFDVYCLGLSEGWHGLVAVVVNRHPDHSVKFMLDATKSDNMISTRRFLHPKEDLKYTDVIEPRSWQVVAVLSTGNPSKPFTVEYKWHPVELHDRVAATYNPELGETEMPLHCARPLHALSK